MESKQLKQITNQLKKAFDNWDFDLAIKSSKDETQTRDNLIHPFLNILNFEKLKDYSHEYIADMGDKKGKRVDVAITLGKKDPIMLVECKSVTAKLKDDHFRQLNEYCLYTPSAKIGILTNGIIYNFYTINSKEKKGLNSKPFFTFDLTNFGVAELEILALFNRQTIEINDILEEAEEVYFLDSFDNALFKTLVENDELAKIIFRNMGGQRSTPKVLMQISDLINSISIKTALDKIIQKEILESNSGIITTEEEIKSYNVIKTILAMTSKIKNSELERISYRDLKNKFIIIVDDKQTKNICTLIFKERSKVIEINGKSYSIEEVSVNSITNLKKELTESALKNLSI
jgi:hypothetical protein